MFCRPLFAFFCKSPVVGSVAKSITNNRTVVGSVAERITNNRTRLKNSRERVTQKLISSEKYR